MIFLAKGIEFKVSKVIFNELSYEAYCDGHLDMNDFIFAACSIKDSEYDRSYKIVEVWNKIELCNKKPCNKTYVTIVAEDDFSRQAIFIDQRRENGFSSDELWNYDSTFLDYLIPRLKAFKDNNPALWSDITAKNIFAVIVIDEMIDGFKILKKDGPHTKQEWAKAQKAWKLFEQHFYDLWY